MRQLLVQVPRGHGDMVLACAARYRATNTVRLPADDREGALDLVIVHVSNQRVGALIETLQRLPDLRVTLVPQGVIALRPPREEAPDQVVDVGHRSPLEIFLGGLQSVGSWTGFLGYALSAGVVVWIGLFTNTSYLLVAAMLIAPFAGPAMNTALATSRGDSTLLRRSVGRYFASLAVTVGVSALLSLLLGQQIATVQMIERSQLSVVAVLLPLVAGAAGALNLIQSERSSLVSGAATGMLVAASLAPPAGLVGMAGAIGRWDLASSGAFVLFLQLAGINLSGAAVFRLAGLSPEGPRFERGRLWVAVTAAVSTLVLLAALLALQLHDRPQLQHASRAQRAAAHVQASLQASTLVQPIEVNTRFTRAEVEGPETLLVELFVTPLGDAPDEATVRRRVRRTVQRGLLEAGFDVTPLVAVTVLEPPEESERAAR